MQLDLLLRLLRICHITPILKKLHWLPIDLRIHFKVLVFCYRSINNIAPGYLCDLVSLYTPSRALRSSDKCLLDVPATKTKYSNRSFSAMAPVLWNSLPLSLRQSNSLLVFKRDLKTHLFMKF